MFLLLFSFFGDATSNAFKYNSHAPSKSFLFSDAFAHRKYALRNRNRNSSSIDLSAPFCSSFCNVPFHILLAISASLKDSSKCSKEYAQIDRFNKTLDASIGSIGYAEVEVERLVVNKSCSKYAFAFVYESNASE